MTTPTSYRPNINPNINRHHQQSTIITQGAYYYFGEARLGQGRERALQYLRDSAEVGVGGVAGGV